MSAGFVIVAPLMLVVAVLVGGFAWTHWCDVYESKRLPNRAETRG